MEQIIFIVLFSALVGISVLFWREKNKNFILHQKSTELEVRLSAANDKIAERDLLATQWSERFEQLSAKALRDNNEAFFALAKNSFSSLSSGAKNDFNEAVKPIENVLKSFDEKIKKLEEQRQSAYTSLSEQLKMANQTSVALSKETTNLNNALRRPDTRGQWGEMQLRRTVELAGMMEHVDFDVQSSVVSDDNQVLRPDMIIKLPNSRTIVVDAKAPLNGYLEASEATSIADKNMAFLSFSRQIKRHIEKLSEKEYWKQFTSCPEFVIMFLPGENFLSDAFRANEDIIEFGVSKKVILATPITLIALLKAASYGWKQTKLADEAREIANVGNELYKRLLKFSSYFNKIGKSLSESVQAYNDMCASATTRLIPQAKKFQSLGIGSDDILYNAEISISPKMIPNEFDQG